MLHKQRWKTHDKLWPQHALLIIKHKWRRVEKLQSIITFHEGKGRQKAGCPFPHKPHVKWCEKHHKRGKENELWARKRPHDGGRLGGGFFPNQSGDCTCSTLCRKYSQISCIIIGSHPPQASSWALLVGEKLSSSSRVARFVFATSVFVSGSSQRSSCSWSSRSRRPHRGRVHNMEKHIRHGSHPLYECVCCLMCCIIRQRQERESRTSVILLPAAGSCYFKHMLTYSNLCVTCNMISQHVYRS